MLEPVHKNLAKKHSQHGIQRAKKHVHIGIELKARRQRAHSTRPTHSKGARQLKQIAQSNRREHNTQLEPLHDIGTRQLEQVFFLKALENCRLDLDELVRKQECQ